MSTPARKFLMAALVGAFLIQTLLVYSDPIGKAGQPLSPLGLEGRALWHDYNCQSCHQIFGFGGFLGPDLTNFAGRKRASNGDYVNLAAELQTVLSTGSERMPAFHFGADERRALAAYLIELDVLGVGQARVAGTRTAREVLAAQLEPLVRGEALSDVARKGYELMLKSGCIDCHLPNGRSSFRATDLTTLTRVLKESRITDVLTNGLPEKGMPALGLTPDEVAAVLAFLKVLETEGSGVRAGFEAAESGGGSLSSLPWFEYPR